MCGQHAIRERSRTVTWTPRPRPIFALAARWWFLWVVYALVRRRTTDIMVGYCARHLVLRRVCKVAVMALLGVGMGLLVGPYDGLTWSRWQILASVVALVASTIPAGVLATEFHVDDIAEDGSVRLAVEARVLDQVPRSVQPFKDKAGTEACKETSMRARRQVP